MRTTAALTGVIALASAAPAVTAGKNSTLVPPVVVPRVNTQDSNWHIGCDKDHKDKCSYVKGAAATVKPRGDYDETPLHPMYNTPSPSLPHYMSYPPPAYTSHLPHVYSSPPHLYSSPLHEYKTSPHIYSSPTHVYTAPPSSVYSTPPASKYTPPPFGSKPGKPGKPSGPPMCNFVESECIDCVEHPDECTTCNFMFRCGEKKQCQYHGFRETMTMCEEVGEQCDWPWELSEDEEGTTMDHQPYDDLPDYSYGEKLEHSHYDEPEKSYGKPENNYGKPENTHGKPENTYGKPENIHGKPENTYGKPENIHGKPENNYGKPENNYGKPENNYGKPENIHGKPENNYGKPEHVYGKPEHTYGPEPKTPYGKPPVIPEHPYGTKGGEHSQAPYATGHLSNPYGSPYNKGNSA